MDVSDLMKDMQERVAEKRQKQYSDANASLFACLDCKNSQRREWIHFSLLSFPLPATTPVTLKCFY